MHLISNINCNYFLKAKYIFSNAKNSINYILVAETLIIIIVIIIVRHLESITTASAAETTKEKNN